MRAAIPILTCVLFATAAARAANPAPREVLERLEARYQSVTDYQCLMSSEIRGEKKTRAGAYRVWFKKPELIRLRVEQGPDRGSEISVTTEGKVKARPGGLLGKALAVTMEKTDARLRSPRGTYGWASDFGTLYRRLRENLQRAESAEATPVPGSPDRLQLRVDFTTAERVPSREVWTIDTKNWLLVSLDLTEDGKLVEHVQFQDFQENTGLTEAFFNK